MALNNLMSAEKLRMTKLASLLEKVRTTSIYPSTVVLYMLPGAERERPHVFAGGSSSFWR